MPSDGRSTCEVKRPLLQSPRTQGIGTVFSIALWLKQRIHLVWLTISQAVYSRRHLQAGEWNSVDLHEARGVQHGQAEMDEGNQAGDL